MSKIVGKCPLCGGNVFENPKSYGCGNWKEKSCKFTIWKHDFHGHDFTEEEVKTMLEGGEVGPFKLKSKAGKDYTASFYYNKKEKKVDIKFPPREDKPAGETASPVDSAPTEDEVPEMPEVPTMDADTAFDFNNVPDDVFSEDGLPFC